MNATRTTLLHALEPGPLLDAVRAGLGGLMHVEHDLPRTQLAPCSGCFECWVKSPGQCRAKDGANAIMRDIIAGGLQVWVSRLRFGTWAPSAKKALDKCIGLLSPFFAELHGETHHKPRYHQYPRLLAIGILDDDAPDSDGELFCRLVHREGLNLLSPSRGVLVVRRGVDPAHLRDKVSEIVGVLRARPADGRPPPIADEAPPRPAVASIPPPRRAVALIGSAKPQGTSTSEQLAADLLERLRARGVETSLVHLSGLVRLERDDPSALLKAVDGADLLVLAAPVYVDTLPALVTHALHLLVDARPSLALAALIQAGFPEPQHAWISAEVLENAARDAGWRWLGALSAGAGAILVDKRPSGYLRALDRAADELARGAAIPGAAQQDFVAPLMPPWAYRLGGSVGWVGQAWQHGNLLHLNRRPFPTLDDKPDKPDKPEKPDEPDDE